MEVRCSAGATDHRPQVGWPKFRSGWLQADQLFKKAHQRQYNIGYNEGDKSQEAGLLMRSTMKDFFISYTSVDRAWAEWIAWVLENANYTVVLQAWDFRPGSNFVLEMDNALKESDRTIAVLSPSYLEAEFPPPEWAATFSEDPKGLEKKLVPVKVQGCTLEGLLAAIIHIDLVGYDQETAREKLLEGVKRSRAKPRQPPIYPGAAVPLSAEQPRPFPPSALDATLRSAQDTWGERDRLEIYVIANLSVGRTPHDLPIDRDPQLTRLRLLKDAIRHGQLVATLEGERPNAWATVTLEELRKFAENKGHSELLAVVEQWATLHKGYEVKPSIQEVRLRLAALRTAGVQLRNGGRDLDGIAQVQEWIEDVVAWDREVQTEIKKYDLADAEWFGTLDAVPPPRIALSKPICERHSKNYREHDFRLVKLEYLIVKYGQIL